jgi:Flp pilus assembly protein TadG
MFRTNRSRPVSRKKRERGAGQIEFLLSFFTVVFVLYGVIEICMAVYAMNVIGDAAREGVRYAIVHGFNTDAANCSGPGHTPACTDATGANVVAKVRDYARFSLHDVSAMTVNVRYLDSTVDPAGTATGTSPRVQVDVSYTYVPWINLPWTSPTLKASAQGRIVN